MQSERPAQSASAAPGASDESTYEYIVVGSGAGGGPVAARLAEAGHRVLLMEAGGAADSIDYQVPAFHPAASEDPEMSWEIFVKHYSDPAQQRRDSKYTAERHGVFYPRAATLGGCTAHNAMILLYPNNGDWDEIAQITGDPDWRAARMRRHFQRAERCRYRPLQRILQRLLGWNPSRHGFDGWLEVTKADPLTILDDKAMLRLILKGAKTALLTSEHPLARLWHSLRGALDPNDWGLIKGNRSGFRVAPLTVAGGHRVGTRERIQAVQRAYPDRLHVLTGALATRVLLDGDNRAIGVEYLAGEHLYSADPRHGQAPKGTARSVHATREVILAGGAFNTPQLLQLSGIGPAELLERHGIPVRVDLPGVGANLQDRYEVGVVNRMKAPFALLEGATMRAPTPGEAPDPQFRLWLKGRGPYATNGTVVAVTRRSAQAADAAPDLILFGLATNFHGYFPGYAEEVRAARRYFTWAVLKGHTRNRAGSVTIRSSDPTEVPDIDFRYFDDDADGGDLEAVVDAVLLARRMSDGARDLIAEETVPGAGVRTREEIRQFVRDEAWGHHASCTCKIGHADDPQAVLDSRFRVRGTRGLRVVDASVFPRVPGLFIVSAIYTIAEKASDDILADALAGHSPAAVLPNIATKGVPMDTDDEKASGRGGAGCPNTCRRLLWLAAIAALVVLGIGVAGYLRFAADRPVDYADMLDQFKYGSIGSEPGGSVLDAVGGLLPPEPIFAVLPQVCADKLPGGYAALGLLQESGQPFPIGVSRRHRLGVDQVGLNCAVCHTGTIRDSAEGPRRIVAGMPAHQLDIQAFFRFALDCTLDERFTADNLLGLMERNGTQLSWIDRLLYRYFVIPRTREATLVMARRLDRIMGNQVPDWGPGRVDTFNPYKGLQFNWRLDQLPLSELIAASDFPSLWNQKPRDGMHLHWDGNNDSVDERNLSAALGAGVTPVTVDHDRLERVRDWIWTLPPPPYPYPIDTAKAERGRGLYAQYCVDCHADEHFKEGVVSGKDVGTVVPIDAIGTDRHRLDSYTSDFAANQYGLYPDSKYRFTHFRKTQGYANQPLDGVWARAPYLHNGSVPTLRALLDDPAERPSRFYRGYDVFDQAGVGFVSDVAEEGGHSYFLYDTTVPGNGNGGHRYGTELPPDDKDAIVEYLKTF